MWYEIDFKKLAKHLIPVFMRRAKFIALIAVMLVPFIYIYNLFTEYRLRISDRIDMSGRIQYLEKILNDKFFLKNREIFITDISKTIVYLYHKGDMQEPVYLYKELAKPLSLLYLKNTGEGSYNGDFIVNIPSSLNIEENLKTIMNLLNYYKPAGRSYRINIYNENG